MTDDATSPPKDGSAVANGQERSNDKPGRSPLLAVDDFVRGFPAEWRGLLAIGMAFSLIFSLGFWWGNRGLQDRVRSLEDAMGVATSQIAGMDASVRELSGRVTDIERLRPDVIEMLDRVRRIDREVCQAHAPTPADLRDCAGR